MVIQCILQILYAREPDELQAAVHALQCLPHEAYKKRVDGLLKIKQE